MSYRQRYFLLILLDSSIVLTAVFFSSFLVNATLHVITFPIIVSSIVLVISHHFFSYAYKLYKKAWEYASVGELIIILKAVTYSILITGVIQVIMIQTAYFRLLAVTWMLHMLLIGGSRFCWRMVRDTYITSSKNKSRTLIIGAGSAGTMVARQLIQNQDSELEPIAFIDDNLSKQNLDILGIPVIGGIDRIEQAVKEWKIDNIIIAIPSLSKKELNIILQECAKTKAKSKILPMLEDLITGKVSVSQFRDVQVEDLLGREPVELDINSISEYIKDKVVLVTGAGGSIGSEICRQIANFHPEKMVLLGHGENSIYSAEMQLRDMFAGTNIKFYTEIADVQDADKMQDIMAFHRPDVVYHAAAHKHVPLMQRNPEEAVKNNIIGTMNVARAASKSGVGKFVMISTDKAVNPTSVMGATKRLAEMIVQYMDTISSTTFVAVRFGNVLGSRGSVIPRFKTQIQNGGPVTVTHPDMVRYFMTIPEASRLVIQAGALARGGEIFVLDMGEPVKIVDLAINLIKLSGNTIEDIGIEFNGMRPGEKLYEELLSEDEMNIKQQVFPKIYIGKTSDLFMPEIEEIIKTYATLDIETLKNKLLNTANGRVDPKELVSTG
ncbi:NDP-sugar epimerase, includes UDP-GlcNAc-inverting 4,6-dehydratase FlaA1 and capsular polysaccharide biosynthesis protein EpsC [Paenibacillus sp. 1_12]|uniref:polysaccharide biosynthesis protein n=1 Tax=Paenibacillus sp. 1_12 TaxID=1566278 RepID=UPI0008EA9AFB|nr:nucleoside-diphosphate sugar epimerase/dehydratase [Paenibacillus sp. 1_12]SFL16106.1 NDP-sugar epimerase, includes UDP-GlcNAc-inverting 4,6-dehydratase FlaA1 and capsular polysaccharide biosynthesis protein EpsC [Paenibacillus sp. 1_12]